MKCMHVHVTVPSEVIAERSYNTVPSWPKTSMTGHNGPNHTLVSKIIGPPELSLLDSIVNKSCNTECHDNKMHLTVPNMMLYQYLQLKLNLL